MPTTLLVIDVQRALLDELPAARGEALIATLGPLVARARAASTPIVFVRHDGSPAELIPGTADWEIAADVAPLPGEVVVDKRYADAFRDTTLADVLATRDADHLVVCGMQTDVCVDATVRSAAERGYRVTLVADGHATSTPDADERRAQLHATARTRAIDVVRASDLFTP